MKEFIVTLKYTAQRQIHIQAPDEEAAALIASSIYATSNYLDATLPGGICSTIICGNTRIHSPTKLRKSHCITGGTRNLIPHTDAPSGLPRPH